MGRIVLEPDYMNGKRMCEVSAELRVNHVRLEGEQDYRSMNSPYGQYARQVNVVFV